MSDPERYADAKGFGGGLLRAARDESAPTGARARVARKVGIGIATGAAVSLAGANAAGAAKVAGATKVAGAAQVASGTGAALSGAATSAAGVGAASGVGSAAGVAGMSAVAKWILIGALGAGTVWGSAKTFSDPSSPASVPASIAAALTSARPALTFAPVGKGPAVLQAPEAVEAQRSLEIPVVATAATSVASSASAGLNAPARGTALVEPTAKGTAGLQDEVRAIDSARTHLRAGAAAEALSDVLAYEQAFPKGSLRIEAELIRIEALMKLGRKDAAKQRGEALLARDPEGPLAQRIRTLIQN
jgi:hypothetical protein